MRQRLVSAIVMLMMALAWPSAQQGTRELRGRVVDAQGRCAAGRDGHGPQPGDRHVPRDPQRRGRLVHRQRHRARAATKSSPSCRASRSSTARDLVLEVGKTATHRRGAGGRRRSTETVNVTAESPLVDVTSKEIGGNITSETLTQLPSVNGNFIGFIGLLPGIVPSISTESFGSDAISVNGQDPRNNNYTVDGGNNNDDVIGQRAGMQARTPIEAIQEFQVITNQFDAEFGRTSGAVVNAVTKAGTNNFRGSAFGFFQDGSLTTKDYFAKKNNLTKADTSYQRWGGTVGGPIVQGQDAVLLQPRALRDRPAEHDRDPGAARPERSADDEGSGLEHDHPRRPSDQRQQHLQRALAARDVAADQPDHPARVTAAARRAKRRTSTRRWRSTSTRCCRTPRSTRSA